MSDTNKETYEEIKKRNEKYKAIARRYETGKIGFYDALHEANQLNTHPEAQPFKAVDEGESVEELDLLSAFEAGEAYANECFCGHCDYCLDDNTVKAPDFETWISNSSKNADAVENSLSDQRFIPEAEQYYNSHWGANIPSEPVIEAYCYAADKHSKLSQTSIPISKVVGEI